MKEKAEFNVSVLDFELAKIEATKSFKKQGIMTDNQQLNTLNYGLVEKDGKHYLINSEGVGSIVPLEDERGEIFWYRETFDENGEMTACECAPFRIAEFYFNELMKVAKIKENIGLDKFIKVFGSRLEHNYIAWCDFLSGELVFSED
jgi:hypothetical protein